MILEKIAAKFAGNKAGDIIGKVLEGADSLFTSKEEKMKLQNELIAQMDRALESERNYTLEVLKSELADTANARDREIQLAKDEHTPLLNKIITPLLAIFIVAATFFIWGMILFRHYEPKTSEALIIGALTTICSQTISYYFGSSQGSHAKQKQLDRISNR